MNPKVDSLNKSTKLLWSREKERENTDPKSRMKVETSPPILQRLKGLEIL